MRVGIPEGFEFFELSREPTLSRSIHDEENFSFVLFHGESFSTRLLDRDIVEGRHIFFEGYRGVYYREKFFTEK